MRDTWKLCRLFAVFKPETGPPMLESFASNVRVTADETQLAILHILSAKDWQTTEEVFDRATRSSLRTTRTEVERRLHELASIGVVSSNADEVSVWTNLERGCRPRPFVEFVEVTNCCPATCVMCLAGQGQMRRPRGFMQYALFERIVSMLEPRRGLKPLSLHNAGEPLLHPGLAAMIQLAYEHEVPTEISTNGGHLTLDVYRRLVDAGIARIIVALDATDVETLLAIRGSGARPQDAFRNVEAILNDRDKRRNESPALILQMVKMRANAHQHETFRERYGDLGLPGVTIYLKPLEAPLTSPLLSDNALPPQFFCVAPWHSFGIFWDGSVVPCCFDLNASLSLGNVNQQTLTEIWQGAALRELRRRLVTGQCTPQEQCFSCYHRPDRYRRPDPCVAHEVPDNWL